MDDLLKRVSRLEDGQLAAAQQLDALNVEAIRSRRFRDAQASGELLRRLDPGPLDGSFGLRGAPAERMPDLSTPLLARLRDDAGMATAEGRVDPTGNFGNTLADPTFATAPLNEYALTTTDTLISDATPQWPFWRAFYVLNSGTAPATARTLQRGALRWTTEVAGTSVIDSSGTMDVALEWGAAAGDISVYLAADDYAWADHQIPSWITAGVDIKLPGSPAIANATSVTAYVEITDATGPAANVLAQSDPEDLMALDDLEIRSRLQAALTDLTPGDHYFWRVRIDVVYPASAGNAYISLSQPQLSWSEDGSLPQFTPAAGRWIPEAQRYHGARVYRSAVQSIADVTDVAVTFPSGSATESWDTDAFHDLSTDTARFYAPWGGYYQINAGVGFASSAAGTIRDMWIEANADGIKRAQVRLHGPTAVKLFMTTSCVLYLTAGAYIRMLVRQNTGGALDVLGDERNTFVDISLVGV